MARRGIVCGVCDLAMWRQDKPMKLRPALSLCIFATLLMPAIPFAAAQDSQANTAPVFNEQFPPPFDKYPLGPDSTPHPDIPTGKTFKFEITDSRIYPDTTRTITVYIPAEYTGNKPACTFVFLDGIGFNASVVFDHLIAEHAMPVTIAIGVSPGEVHSAAPPQNPRFDRSFEFDSLSDRFARFLLEEVIPQVESHRTPDGIPIKLSTSPDDRAIAGGSTGGIGAFTVAWEHPEAFHRVFTAIGTFVGMRGGEQEYVLVRKTEPKPLRIFMQDGVHDEWPGGPEMGDWWMSNETMNRALEFAGYDVKHIWGAGSHNGSQAAAIFPEVVRWLWRDWPAPIGARAPGNPVLKQILKAGEAWQPIAKNCDAATTLAADAQGRVFYRSGDREQITELKADGDTRSCARPNINTAFALGPDDKVYLARMQGGIEIRSVGTDDRTEEIRGSKLMVHSLTVRNRGDVYAIAGTGGGDELWLIPAHGEPKLLDHSLKGGTGIAVSPDGLWLFVAQSQSRFGISYRILPDATVDARESFYDFYVPAWADDSGAGQIAMDSDGRAYVATRIGVQTFDRNGRVTAILPLPGNEQITGICFGGQHLNTLYVSGEGKIYARTLNVMGAPDSSPPLPLPPWGAG
jgi:gluconolactonase